MEVFICFANARQIGETPGESATRKNSSNSYFRFALRCKAASALREALKLTFRTSQSKTTDCSCSKSFNRVACLGSASQTTGFAELFCEDLKKAGENFFIMLIYSLGVSIPHALSKKFKYIAAGDTLKFYLLISNFYLLDVAASATSYSPMLLHFREFNVII